MAVKISQRKVIKTCTAARGSRFADFSSRGSFAKTGSGGWQDPPMLCETLNEWQNTEVGTSVSYMYLNVRMPHMALATTHLPPSLR